MMFKSDSEIALIIAQRFKQERLFLQLTQVDLAKRALVSVKVVRNFEQHGKINLINLIALTKALNRSNIFDDLFNFEKERIELDVFEYMEQMKKNKNRKRVRKKKR